MSARLERFCCSEMTHNMGTAELGARGFWVCAVLLLPASAFVLYRFKLVFVLPSCLVSGNRE